MTGPSEEQPAYTGPPPTVPPPGNPGSGQGYAGGYPGGYGPPAGYRAPGGYPGGYGYPGAYPGAYPGGYGYPGYGYAPARPTGPRRPGQLVAAAVLAFVQAAITLVATFYVFVLATFAGAAANSADTGVPVELAGLATEGRILSAVQLAGVVLLVVGGVLALNRRAPLSWVFLVAALGVQICLAAYWIVRVGVLSSDLANGNGATTVFVVLGLFFAAMPVTGLVLACIGPSRRWLRPAGYAAG